MFRTGSHTFAAGLAGFFVNDSHAVHHMDGVKGTGLHTGTLAEASERTTFRSAVLHHVNHDTVMYTIIVVCLFRYFTVSCTFYKCHFPDLLTSIHSHDLAYFGCHRGTAYRTGVNRSFSF